MAASSDWGEPIRTRCCGVRASGGFAAGPGLAGFRGPLAGRGGGLRGLGGCGGVVCHGNSLRRGGCENGYDGAELWIRGQKSTATGKCCLTGLAVGGKRRGYRATPSSASAVSRISAASSAAPSAPSLARPAPRPPTRRWRPARPARPGRPPSARGPSRGRRAAVGVAGAGGPGDGRAPAAEAGLRPRQLLVGPLPVGLVVVREQRQPDRHRVDARPPAAARRRPGCRATWTSSRPGSRPCRSARRPGRTASSPQATRACEPLISWCGNTRSLPPACTSKDGPEVLGGDGRALHVPARPPGAEAGRPRRARPAAPPARRAGRAGPSCPAGPGRRRARPTARSSARPTGRRRCPARTARRTPGPRRGRSRRRRRGRRGSRGRRAARRTTSMMPIASTAPMKWVGGRFRSASMSRRYRSVSRSRELAPVLAVALGPLEQRVVHVGDVLGVDHLVPAVKPRPDQQVPGGEGGGVAQVGRVVGGDPAGVQRRPAPGGRDGELPGRRVPQPYFRPAPRQNGNLSATP